MKRLMTAVFAATLAIGTSAAFAQTNGAMSHDTMKKDDMSHGTMGKDDMSHSTMGKGDMSHDSMKKSGMKDPGAMGTDHSASGTMAK